MTLEGTPNTKQPENEWHLTSDRPVFIQIMEKLKLDIVTGVYAPGDKLPSVRDLAGEAAVNPNTMQRAMAQLEADGLATGSRTSGRTVTRDAAVIEAAKKARAQEAVALCLQILEELGYSKPDALEFMKEELKHE